MSKAKNTTLITLNVLFIFFWMFACGHGADFIAKDILLIIIVINSCVIATRKYK